MRIMIASSIYLPMLGGLPLFAHRLGFYFQERGHAVKVLAPSLTPWTKLRVVDGVEILGMASVKAYFYKNFRLTLAPRLYQRLEKEILDFKPDVIHIQGHYAIERRVVKIAKRHGIAVVGTNHTAFESVETLMPFSKIKPIVRWVERLFWQRIKDTFQEVTLATVPSHAAKKMLQDHGVDIPMTVVSNGLDANIFNPAKRNSKIRKKYNLPDAPLLLTVGRLDVEKKLSFALAGVAMAMKKIRTQNNAPPFYFVIVGDGGELQSLKKEAKQHGIADHVLFLGMVKNTMGAESDLPALYAEADVFITASPMELQGIAVMEAMASGLPILATNARALPELVSDGENGFLFNLDNPDLLADKIVRVFNDDGLRQKMAADSLKKIQQHDVQTVVTAFENIYKKAIDKLHHPK